jgi:hypothetical protein
VAGGSARELSAKEMGLRGHITIGPNYADDDRFRSVPVPELQIRRAVVAVAEPCRMAGWISIPACVDAVASTLEALTKQELWGLPCSRSFPPRP